MKLEVLASGFAAFGSLHSEGVCIYGRYRLWSWVALDLRAFDALAVVI